MEEPLPAGFFQRRVEDEDYWIQFKYEQLSDFCYKCGVISHVTSRCSFEDPATITTANGISTKLFGPWLRSEHSGSLCFVNPKSLNNQSAISPAVIETKGKEIVVPEGGALIKNLTEYFAEKKRSNPQTYSMQQKKADVTY